jgi:hypothetical protein
MSCEIRIEQNLGPHIEQKCADLVAFLRQGLVVELLRAVSGSRPRLNWSSQRNSKRALRQCVVAHLRGRVALGQIGGVGGDLVGDDADLHVVAVGQAQVLLGRDVAEHRGAEPADHRRADGAGDVVVARRDIRGQRPERVEGRLAAVAFSCLSMFCLDLVHRHVAGAFDHHLQSCSHAIFVSSPRVRSSANCASSLASAMRAGAQAVAEREGDVIGLHDVADLVEMFVEEALLVMRQTPLGHDRAAARDDAGHAVGGQRDEGRRTPAWMVK